MLIFTVAQSGDFLAYCLAIEYPFFASVL